MAQQIHSAAPGLRPSKRYITSHDADGKSVYVKSPDQVYNLVPGVGGMARSYATNAVPANLADDADVHAYKAEDGAVSYQRREVVIPDHETSSNLVVVDLEPGAVVGSHRTMSIDYAVCVAGELDHTLDGGETVRLSPGDHIIQRGTMHSWVNPSRTESARFVAVTIPCVPFKVAGKLLEEVRPGRK